MIDVLWARWAPLLGEPLGEQPWDRHRRFLDHLLALESTAPGDLRHAPDVDAFEEAWHRAAPPERQGLAAVVGTPSPTRQSAHWSTAESLDADRRYILDGLQRCAVAIESCSFADGEQRISPDRLEAASNLFAHRVHLRGSQLHRLAPPRVEGTVGHISFEGNADLERVHACIDFRIHEQLGSLWLYATLSLWNSRPSSSDHAPPVGDAPRLVDRRPVGELRRLFEKFREEFKTSLIARYLTVETTVVRDIARSSAVRPKYRPPCFWVALCRGGAEHLLGPGCSVIDDLSREVLLAPSASARDVAIDVVESRQRVRTASVPLVVLRRLTRRAADPDPSGAGKSANGAAPVYVIVPLSATPPPTREAREAEAATQEETIQQLVYELTTVETSIAAHLLKFTTELDIDHGSARIYNSVVKKASELWDQLAMHLPLAKGAELDELHQIIELLHLILLEGLADLGHLKSDVNARAAELPTVHDERIETFDSEFMSTGEVPWRGRAGRDPEEPAGGSDPKAPSAPESLEDEGAPRPSAGRSGLSVSLRTGGYVAPTQRWARGVATGTTSTLERYTELLEAISKAFDERRVRVTDKIGGYGLFLAAALGLVAFVSETYGKWIEKLLGGTAPAPNASPAPVAPPGVVIGPSGAWPFGLLTLALLIVVIALGYGLWHQRIRGLGALHTTKYFGDTFPLVRRYLQSCRTETLAGHLATERRTRQDQQPGAGDDDESHSKLRQSWVEYHKRWNDIDLRLARAYAEVVDRLLAPRTSDNSRPSHHHALRVEVENWALASLLASQRPRYFYRYPVPCLTLLYRFTPALAGIGTVLVSDADLQQTLRVQCAAELRAIPDVTAWGHSLRQAVLQRRLTMKEMLEKITDVGVRSGLSDHEWRSTHRAIRDELGGEDGIAVTPPTRASSVKGRVPPRLTPRPSRCASGRHRDPGSGLSPNCVACSR